MTKSIEFKQASRYRCTVLQAIGRKKAVDGDIIVDEYGLLHAFGQCGSAARPDTLDIEEYKRFKYAMGKNYLKLVAIEKRIEARMNEIAEKAAEDIDNSHRECEEKTTKAARRLAMVDVDGQIMPDEDGNMRFTKENEEILHIEIAQITEAYNALIDDAKACARDDIDSVYQEVVEVDLHRIDFACCPETIVGSWSYLLAPVFVNAPELHDAPAGSEVTDIT